MPVIRKLDYFTEGKSENIPKITHSELVNRAEAWLRGKGYRVTAKELHTSNSETPDVMGFGYGGDSCLIECKTSRPDFFADKNKSFRRDSQNGMGQHRYYAVPVGLVKPEELPDGLGLLNVYEKIGGFRSIRKAKDSLMFDADKHAEVNFLVSILRRLRISTAVFIERVEKEKRE